MKRSAVFIFLILAGCTADQQLSRARKLEMKGKNYKAWQLYQAFAAKHPKHSGAPEALFHAGWLAQRELKNCDSAAVFYDKVLEAYPQSDPWARLATHQKSNCPDYFPLYPGTQWVEGDSDTLGKNARIETICKPTSDRRFPSETGLLVKTYFGGTVKFKTVSLEYRKASGELQEFSPGDEIHPKTVFRLPPTVGTRWRTRSGERLFTYEVIAIDKTVKVQGGEFSPCVLVKSTVDGVAGATNEYYAPDVGRILTAFVTQQGEKRNIELLSYKPNKEFDFKELDTKP